MCVKSNNTSVEMFFTDVSKFLLVTCISRVPTAQGKWLLFFLSQGISKFCQKAGTFVWSSSKFPDSKDTGYCNFCHEI